MLIEKLMYKIKPVFMAKIEVHHCRESVLKSNCGKFGHAGFKWNT